MRRVSRSRERRLTFILMVLVILCCFAVLLVGWEVLQQRLFPSMSTALRHALLTIRAGVVTAIACTVVYMMMRRQQRRLSDTADQLARLLESYQSDAAATARFENPHLVHCRELMDCHCAECPVYDAPGMRCWQFFALGRTDGGHGPTRLDIQNCHRCEVYRASCPDKLTELGESFNSLMFLLNEEKQRLDCLRSDMAEKEKMVAVGQLAAGVAHEVGNPLSSISSIIQLLKRGRSKELPIEQLNLIESHLKRISTIVRGMVTFARPREERWEPLDVSDILDRVIALITFDRRARGVQIEFERPKALLKTRVLGDQLQQVFLNLTINALDAMPHGGVLTIRALKNRSNILVRVQDSGCGIDPDAGRRIFEPFFTTKDPGCGSGLGLSVSYGIIQKHGGTIDFHSKPGDGTEFIVKIPITHAKHEGNDTTKHGLAGR
ncbi:MAG: hypothetical protein JSV78_01580 [Phycisphaerales bacterium]|nr:MAG: hypothetical protein JSV78_01580 [Phycisphaerales bacterium]